MRSVLFEASYGGVRLDIVAVADEMSRRLAAQRPARGEGALLQNRGRDERRSRCTVEFFDRGDGDDALARRRAFLALAAETRAQLFTHPIDGTWPARIGELSASWTPNESVVEVEFVEDVGDPRFVRQADAGVHPRAGAASVANVAQRAEAALATAGVASDVPAAATAQARSWSTNPSPPARAVFLELDEQTAAIDAELARLDAGGDLSRFAVYVAMHELAAELRRAAGAATADTRRLFEITVRAATPLLALCAMTYGADAALVRYAQIRALNALDTPLVIPAGTVLVAPAVREVA